MQVDGRLFPERLKQVPEYEKMFKEAFGGEPGFGSSLNAIAAFVRTLSSRNVPFDRYLKGEKKALPAAAVRGLDLFMGKAACVQCHSGPLLSDGKFHALGVPENPQVFSDPLRHISYRRFLKTLGVPGYMGLREDVGLFAVTKNPNDRGKFRTPTLREVGQTAPYMHNGAFKTLEEVVAFYGRGGGRHPNKSPLLKTLGLKQSDQRDLVEFLKSLSGDPVVMKAPTLPEYKPRKLGAN